MKKLLSLLLTAVLAVNVIIIGLAVKVSADETENTDNYTIKCTEQEAYEKGYEFFKMWYIVNKGNYNKLCEYGDDESYIPPHWSEVLSKRKDDAYKWSYWQWKMLTLDFPSWIDGLEHDFNNTSAKQKALYEAYLFNLLLDDSNNSLATTFTSEYSSKVSDLDKVIKNSGVSEWSAINNFFGDVIQRSDIITGKSFEDRLSKLYEYADTKRVGKKFEFLEDVTKLVGYVDTLGEYVDGLTRLSVLAGSNQEAADVLADAKTNLSKMVSQGYWEHVDQAMYSALDNFTSYLDESMTEEEAFKIFIGDRAVRDGLFIVGENVFDIVCNKVDAAMGVEIAKTTADLTKIVANDLFGTEDQYTAFSELETYFDFEIILRIEANSIVESVKNGYEAKADLFDTTYAMVKNAYLAGLDSYDSYISKCYKEGMINSIWPGINSDKYDKAKTRLTEMQDTVKKLFNADMVNSENAYIDAMQKYDPDLYEELYGTSSSDGITRFDPIGYLIDELRTLVKTLSDMFHMELKRSKTLTEDQDVFGNITINSGDLNVNGKELTVYGNVYLNGGSFTGRGIVNIKGDVYQKTGTFTVPDGCFVTIDGSLVQSGGTVMVSGGSLTVGGDHVIGTYDADTGSYSYTSTTYYYINSSGTEKIGGNLTGYYVYGSSLDSGNLEVGGSAVCYISGSNINDIRGDSDLTMTLKGSDPVRLQNLSGMKISIENAGSRDITMAGYIYTPSLLGGAMTIIPENLSLGVAAISGDMTINGDVTLRTFNMSGHNLTVNGIVTHIENLITVDGLMKVMGSLTQTGGTITINSSGSLIVPASLLQKGGTVTVTGGSLTVGGDHVIGTYDADTGSYHYTATTYYYIYSGGTEKIGGDLTGYYVYGSSLDSGNLEVGGSAVSYNSSSNINAISGDSDLTMTLKGSDPVRLQNLNGMKISIENAGSRDITMAGYIDTPSLLGGAMTIIPENLSLGVLATSGDMTINGDVTLRTFNMSGHNLTVLGDVIHNSGNLQIGTGTLDIDGDFSMATYSNGTYSSGSGTINMSDPDCVVKVSGDMLVWSTSKSTLTDGTLYISGDFTESSDSYKYGFVCSNNHTTILDGEGIKHVTFASYPDSHFNVLRLMQIKANYVFSPEVCWNTIKYYCAHRSTEVRGHVDATCTEKGYTGDLYCLSCEELLEQGSVIPALGHDWEDEYRLDRNPSLTETGCRSIHCSRCDATRDEITLPKLTLNVASDFTGFAQSSDPDRWFYIEKGNPTTRTALIKGTVKGTTTWWRVENGEVIFEDGFASNSNGTYYVKAGAVDFKFNGYAADENGDYYVVKKGKVTAGPVSYIQSLTAAADGIKISWVPVSGAASYRIYYKVGSGKWTKITDVSAATGSTGSSASSSMNYTWTKAVSGTTYTFAVRGLAENGTSYVSVLDPESKSLAYVKAPVVTKAENAVNGIKITWGTVAGAEKYRLFYKVGSGKWTKVADVDAADSSAATQSYTWTKAVSGTTYTFVVRALNAAGTTYTSALNSNGKSIAYVAAPKVTKAENTATGVKVTWGTVKAAEKYRIFYKVDGGKWTKITDVTASTAATQSYTWTGAASGKTYTFVVRAVNSAGTTYTSALNTAGKTILYIKAPKVTSAVNTSSGIKVTWGASAGAEKYRLFYKVDGGKWTKVADTASTSYTWNGAVSGTTYTFVVRAVNAAGTAYTSALNTSGVTIQAQ